MTFRPRRSMLYMPGSNARAIEKAKTLPVDGIILDLEDAVAPEAKDAARRQVAEAVKAGGFGAREVLIRLNGLDTPWAIDDINAAVAAAPDGIVIPKVADPQTLLMIGTRLLDMHADHRTRVWAMMETPFAILRASEIAAVARDSESRLAGLILGTNDLVKETHGRIVAGRAPLAPMLTTCVLAARAYGIAALDGVYNDLQDADGFARECAQARDMGFDGKTLVHPNQVEPCHTVFSPSAEEVSEARKIVAAFDLPENKDKGVVRIDGRMVERMHAEMASRTVAIAEAIAGRE